MGAVITSAFALALFCFLVLSAVCIGSIFAFIYRRYYGIPRRRAPVPDLEAQSQLPSSASSLAKAQESATLTGSSDPRDLGVDSSPKSSGPTACPDEKLDRLAKPTPKPSENDESTWKRRTLSWLLVARTDIRNHSSSLDTVLAKAKAKVKEKWIPFDSDTSLATVDVTPLSDDVPSPHPTQSSSVSPKKSTLDTRSTSSYAEGYASAPLDPFPLLGDAVLASAVNAPRSSTYKKSHPTPWPSTSKPAPTSRESVLVSASNKLTSAVPEPTSTSSPSTLSLASTVVTPATTWEPQTPHYATTAPTSVDRSGCQPSPSTDSLEVRSTDLNVAALAQSEVILGSGSLPSCVSGLSDVIACLDVRSSLIEDLAKTAVHPTLGLGFDASLLSQAAISISLMPPKVLDAPPLDRPTLSTSNTATTTCKENVGLGNSFISSDSKTACGADVPEQKTDDERYAALVDALSTTFSVASLHARGSTWQGAMSVSTSSSPSMDLDQDLGLDTSYELSYDASESDFDGFCGSDDEGFTDKLRPHRAAPDPSLLQSSSRSEHSVIALPTATSS